MPTQLGDLEGVLVEDMEQVVGEVAGGFVDFVDQHDGSRLRRVEGSPERAFAEEAPFVERRCGSVVADVRGVEVGHVVKRVEQILRGRR